MVIGTLLAEAATRLSAAGISTARLDSEVLLAHLLKKDRLFLAVHRKDEVTQEIKEQFMALVERRAQHEPVAYLTGQREFMSLTFAVSPGVLIPRPDTETLVELVIQRFQKEKEVTMLDLCTGSGAIAVSLAHYLPQSRVTGVDISELCVETARKNAETNGVANRVTMLVKDVFALPDGERYNCVVSNPPYIPGGVLPTLEADVRDYEPQKALDGGADGLVFYRHLAKICKDLLLPGGFLALEVGHDQAEAVTDLLINAGGYQNIGTEKDLSGINRVVYAEKAEDR